MKKYFTNIYHNKINRILTLLLMFLFSYTNAQTLPTFTLSVTPTAQSCPGNGVLSFSTTGTDPLATVSYSAYLSGNLVAGSPTTNSSLTGLSAGSYTVIATQSRAGYTSNTQTVVVSINNTYTALVYTVSSTNAVCGSDGTVTVGTITAGTLNATNPYALYDATGTTVVKAPQASNVFTGVAAGTYLVKVTDACGQIKTATINVARSKPTLWIGGEQFAVTNCTKGVINIPLHPGSQSGVVNSGDVIVFPVTITAVTKDPSGTIVDNQTWTYGTAGTYTGGWLLASPPVGFSYNFATNYTTAITVTDACGNNYSNTGSFIVQHPTGANVGYVINGCSSANLTFSLGGVYNPFTVNFTSWPAAYTGPTTISGLTDGTQIPNTPDGTYKFTVTDACGYTTPLQTYTLNSIPSATGNSAWGNCSGFGDVVGNSPSGREYVSATITTYPAAYTGPLTVTRPAGGGTNLNVVGAPYIYGGGTTGKADVFYMVGVPLGNYTVQLTDACGTNYTVTYSVTTSDFYNPTYTVTPGCSNFTFTYNNTGTGGLYNTTPIYYLQYYNSTTGTWGPVGELPKNGSGQSQITKGIATGNISVSGNYRLVVDYNYNGFVNGGAGSKSCTGKVLYNFTYNYSDLAINKLYSIACSNGTYNTYISATGGNTPYTFSIVAQQGNAGFTAVSPVATTSTSAIFGSLPDGIYKFEIKDNCGNTKNYWQQLSYLPAPKISASSPFCDGSNSYLSVEALPGVSFSWTKGSPTGTVIGTGNTLNFTPLNLATNAGTYYVTLSSSIPNTCLNYPLSFTVPTTTIAPNAGSNKTYTYCASTAPLSLDLNSILDPAADPGGTWAETTATPSGLLSGARYWFPSLVPAGTYTFSYTVNGLCSGTAAATYTIIVMSPTVAISGNATVCVSATAPFIKFTGSGGVAPYTFTYTLNGGANQTVTSDGTGIATITQPTTTAGNYVYALVSVQDANTCSNVQTGTATVKLVQCGMISNKFIQPKQ